MTEHYASLLAKPGGAAGRTTVEAPWDRAPIAEVDTTGLDDVERALEVAWGLSRNRAGWLSVPRRIEILERAARLVQEQSEFLAVEAAREGGKPLVDSRVEVERAIDSLRLCADFLRTDAGEAVPMGLNAASANRRAFTIAEPIGVVVAISAFNHPLNLIAHQVGPAIAAGCPVIVKPAEDTPLSCWRLVRILHEAGLPPEWCQALVTENHDVAEALVTDRRVGFLSFIGSAKVGWMLRSKLAPGARCALEHGGVAPVIVAADADLDIAVPKLLKGGFYHAGQVCVSVQRVFADRAIAQDLAARLAEGAAKLRIGDPAHDATEVGPLIRPGEVSRVAEWVDEAVAGGGIALSGGKVLSETTYACTVLENPPADSRVSTQEVFGPVVCVYSYEEINEAITRANSLPYAFQSAVFTQDIDTAMHASRALDASAVMVNDHTAFRVDWMPFAGLRESGLGVGGIPHTIRDMSVRKMVVLSEGR